MSQKRTIEAFFQKPAKRPRTSEATVEEESCVATSNHSTYPFPVKHFPLRIANLLSEVPASKGRVINDQPDLDLLYFQPYIPKSIDRNVFEFLRGELFFYRVQYKIKRGTFETQINTPRFTTVFGLDETAKFAQDGTIVDAKTSTPVPQDCYKICNPRPIPHCLDELRKITEIFTSNTYNFCLVNYYASGADSISYHSDDERFLGSEPAIASFSLGAKRDFLMKHKPPPKAAQAQENSTEAHSLKLPLASGDMILMCGRTQANWLHSIPKRKDGESNRGRINITFRKAMVKGGTENYYQYNVGTGVVWKWNGVKEEMQPWLREESNIKNPTNNKEAYT